MGRPRFPNDEWIGAEGVQFQPASVAERDSLGCQRAAKLVGQPTNHDQLGILLDFAASGTCLNVLHQDSSPVSPSTNASEIVVGRSVVFRCLSTHDRGAVSPNG